ncbi:MAG: acetylesterase [Treponema sp.]|jgi:S-formylglutathione hydrolase FrmB|nr:acetylesterase [Treponema sp.]
MILQGSIFSETLNMSVGLSVFFPEKLQKRNVCRTVYLLHGLHGDNGTWLYNTMLPVIAKNTDSVFIMPEVGRSFYADMKRGYRYFTYVSEELPEICKRNFNISTKREDTAVMGCSMGGYGALKLALSKPDRYGFCGAISPACLFLDELLYKLRKEWERYSQTGREAASIIRDFKAIFGDDFQYDSGDVILELARNAEKAPEKPKIYMACGTDDDLLADNRRFAEEMKRPDFDCMDCLYEEWTGAHDWKFFNEALAKALQMWNERA